MSVTPDNKPCPFCTQPLPDDVPHVTDVSGKWGAVCCPHCDARGPEVRTDYRDWPHWREAALGEWNRRG